MPEDVTPTEPVEQTPAEARAAFLASPPEILPTDEPVVLDAEAEVLDEVTRPPAEPAVTVPAAPADPFAPYGGAEEVANAYELAQALRTETGVRLVVKQSLTALGYSDAQIAAALGGGPGAAPAVTNAPEPAAAPDPFAGIDDDDVVTGGDVKRLLAEAVKNATEAAVAQAQAQLDPVRQQFEQERNREIAARNDATIVEVLGPVPEDPTAREAYVNQARDLLNVATRFVDPTNFDPSHIRNGIIAAHAEIEANAEARYQAHLARKREARKAAPTNIGGTTATDGAEAEPKNLAEARAQAKASGTWL